MTEVKIWMPLYCGDYLRDTLDLTHAEHGAYLLSMMAYWSNAESLTDRKLRGVCGKEFERVSEFYIYADGRWHHKRIDEELSKSRERRKIAHENSMKGVEARRKLGQI